MNFDWRKIYRALNAFITRFYKFFLVAEVLIIFFIGWLVLLRGEYRIIQESGVLEYDLVTEQLQDQQDRLVELRYLEEQYTTLDQERLRQLEEVLPHSYNPTALITTMNQFAEQASIEIASIDVAQTGTITTETTSTATTDSGEEEETIVEVANPNIKTVTITMNIKNNEGTYGELKYFLSALETFVPILDMRQLSFSPGTDSMALQLQTYYFNSSSAL